jgi:hypothetical protein
MQCEQCGTSGDWIGEEKQWDRVSGGAVAVVGIYECNECGNRQHAR